MGLTTFDKMKESKTKSVSYKDRVSLGELRVAIFITSQKQIPEEEQEEPLASLRQPCASAGRWAIGVSPLCWRYP